MSYTKRTNLEIPCLTQLRNNIYNILTNISELERCMHDNQTSVAHVDSLKQQTDEILKRLEEAPLENYREKLKKKNEIRKRKKLRLQLMKTALKSKQVHQQSSAAALEVTSTAPTYSNSSAAVTSTLPNSRAKTTKQKPHNRLLKHNDAQRFLRTFELLKILHYKRSHDAQRTGEFAEQLSDLRATWSKVLDENAPESRQEQHVEDQWNEVFFGPTEHSYYGGEPPKTSEFLDLRRVWDSYLTHSKHGSSIPCGWVLPRENAMGEWQQYRAPF